MGEVEKKRTLVFPFRLRGTFSLTRANIYCVLVFSAVFFLPALTAGDPFFQSRSQVYSSAQTPRAEDHNPAPKVAIIIDDLGLKLSIARSFLELDAPLAFSILPRMAYSREIAKWAHQKNRDVLLHIPMEPHKYPEISAGSFSLLSSMNRKNMEKTLKAGLESIPFVVGANNHMGSRLTENKKAMRVVLAHLKSLNLFFVDSVTSSNSVAYQVAKEIGIRTARRNVFLDNRKNRVWIAKQFRKLKKTAIVKGSAIGIGHPHPATLSVLREMIPDFRKNGINIVSVSELVQ